MIVANGSTDVTTYFVLRDSTNHAPKTDVTITDIDLYYLEQGAAMAAKVDATALAAADSAHADNKGYHCGQGLYRIDWPDEAFNGGVGKRAYLIVVCTGVDTTFLEVELSPNVNTNSLTADVITAAGIADNAFANEHFANGALTSTEITSAGGCVVASIANDAITAASIATDAITDDAIATGAITSTAFANNSITNAAVADDVDVNVKTMTAGVITSTVLADDCITAAKLNTDAIAADAFAQTAADKVWGTAARVLTAIDEDSTTLDLDATIASAVWNALTASYVGAGTTGKVISDILADTNELQTDDTPTAIAALATTLGVAGAGLTAIPWNAAWDAEVQSECTDALNAYDPPTKAELDSAQAAVTVSAIANNAITAAAIATDAIDADALKADAITEIQNGLATAAALTTVDTVVDLIEDIVRNKMEITDANGNLVLYADDSTTPLYSVAACVTDDLTTTTRKRLA